ncbi:hypothetical protein JZ751_014379 [Albula glossodonta]|uniref:Uncharacterized protein n=1 Tax=Albula glossodonta TaxID=121402 RepID=A0A8T2P172_9TELE|nr:hypothetical protein JZ751_014379 [Albula glossodonta]
MTSQSSDFGVGPLSPRCCCSCAPGCCRTLRICCLRSWIFCFSCWISESLSSSSSSSLLRMLHFISSMAAIRDSEILKWAFSCQQQTGAGPLKEERRGEKEREKPWLGAPWPSEKDELRGVGVAREARPDADPSPCSLEVEVELEAELEEESPRRRWPRLPMARYSGPSSNSPSPESTP